MTYAQRMRYRWISQRLREGVPFTRQDIQEMFYVTTQTASATIKSYKEEFPNRLRYDASAKVFVPVGWKSPSLSDEVEEVGMNAPLPSHMQWGRDAMCSFDFGKSVATSAIIALLKAKGL